MNKKKDPFLRRFILILITVLTLLSIIGYLRDQVKTYPTHEHINSRW